MDWLKQSEELFKSWTQTQQTMWENWTQALKSGPKPQAASTWTQTIATWENAVKNMLESQALWTRMWARSFSALDGAPADTAKWVEQTEALSKVWLDFQESLWQNWFGLVKKLDPNQLQEQWSAELEKGMQTWQANVQKMRDTQAEWTQNWPKP